MLKAVWFYFYFAPQKSRRAKLSVMSEGCCLWPNRANLLQRTLEPLWREWWRFLEIWSKKFKTVIPYLFIFLLPLCFYLCPFLTVQSVNGQIVIFKFENCFDFVFFSKVFLVTIKSGLIKTLFSSFKIFIFVPRRSIFPRNHFKIEPSFIFSCGFGLDMVLVAVIAFYFSWIFSFYSLQLTVTAYTLQSDFSLAL